MGYNMVAVILNDAAHIMERDPDFGRRTADAVRGWSRRDRERLATDAFASCILPSGGMVSCSALTVISQDHADGEQVVIVHGNTGQRCDDANDLGWHALE